VSKRKKEKKRILIADDDEDTRHLFKEILSDKYYVIEVRNGEQLLSAVDTVEPDLIIADIVMPKIDGLRAIRRLRQRSAFSTTPVIFISAAITDKKLYESLKPEGPSIFMTKPIDDEVLLETVEELLKNVK